ncbi:hypothetical protein L083_7345 [Actinoplanes sp. N902-109]|nr:hypothetical protein L083_7345 [Actinoplanes sp. N902-109]
MAAVAAAGSGVAAYGGWNVGGWSPTFTVHAVRIPRMLPPSAQLGTDVAGPRIGWEAIVGQAPVQRYVVTRHLGAISAVACAVEARATNCVDRHAPVGRVLTYTVAAAWGTHWSGVDSAPSVPVLVPGAAAPLPVIRASAMPSTSAVVTPNPASTSESPPPSPAPSRTPRPPHRHDHDDPEPSAAVPAVSGGPAGEAVPG